MCSLKRVFVPKNIAFAHLKIKTIPHPDPGSEIVIDDQYRFIRTAPEHLCGASQASNECKEQPNCIRTRLDSRKGSVVDCFTGSVLAPCLLIMITTSIPLSRKGADKPITPELPQRAGRTTDVSDNPLPVQSDRVELEKHVIQNLDLKSTLSPDLGGEWF